MLRKLLLSSTVLALSACGAEDALNGGTETDTTITISPAKSTYEVDERTVGQDVSLDIRISLSRPAPEAFEIPYHTEDGSALSGSDYASMSGSLSVAEGDRQVVLSPQIFSDGVFEGRESFTLTLAEPDTGLPENVVLEDTEIVVHIGNSDPEPVIEFATDVLYVAEAVGTVNLELTLDRETEVEGQFTLELGGVATREADYTLETTRHTWSPGETTKSIPIGIIEDDIPEGGESIIFSLSGANELAIGESRESSIVIRGQTVVPDTAVMSYYNNGDFSSSAPDSLHPGQDADHGLDVAARQSGKSNSMDYTKLDTDGNALPSTATDYECVRDNHTGVVWEYKDPSTDIELDAENDYANAIRNWRAGNYRYLWYQEDDTNDGGVPGGTNDDEMRDVHKSVSKYYSCAYPHPDSAIYVDPARYGCSTIIYVKTLNREALCGYTDWRLPTVSEMQEVILFEEGSERLDTDYFRSPSESAPKARFLTGTPSADNDASTWCVEAETGRTMLCNKTNRYSIIATRRSSN